MFFEEDEEWDIGGTDLVCSPLLLSSSPGTLIVVYVNVN